VSQQYSLQFVWLISQVTGFCFIDCSRFHIYVISGLITAFVRHFLEQTNSRHASTS